MARYPVPRSTVRVEVRVSNSRFIATAGRADTAKDAQAFIRGIRAEMPDATHHVYAFRVGYGASVSEGMSDDGEPSGTSGPPALAVVRGTDVGDVVLVITRYFGGTKLGTGGLVSAYTAAAQEAMAALPTEEKVDRVRVAIEVPYTLRERVHQLIAAHEGRVEQEDYAAEITLQVVLPEEQEPAFAEALRECSAGRVEPRRVEEP